MLVVLVVLVGWYVLFVPKDTTPIDERPEPETTRALFDPKPETIVKMRYERAGQDTLTFAKSKADRARKGGETDAYDDWRFVEPFEAKAVNWSLDSLANKVRDLKYRQRDDTITDETAGLNPPRATIAITDSTDTEHTVEIGKSAAGGNTFVRVQGEKTVYIVDAKFDDDIKKKLDDYRDKDLVALTSNDAVSIVVTHEGVTYRMTRDANKDWIFSEPFSGYGDNAKVNGLADNVNYLRASEYVDGAVDDLSRYGLDKPRLTVGVTTEKALPADPAEAAPTTQDAATQDAEPAEPKVERKTVDVAFGGFADLQQKTVYLQIAGQAGVVKVQKTDYDKFVPKPNEWREMKITRSKVRTATKAELAIAGETVTLTKEGARWRLPSGDADTAATADMLKAVADLEATQYRELTDGGEAELGLDQPRAVLTLTVPDQTEPERITVGGESKSKTMAYVRRGSGRSVGVVRAESVARLLQPAVAYRDRKVFTFGRQQARQIDLLRKSPGTAAPVALTLVKDEQSRWRMTQPIDAEVERQAATDILSDLSRLRAKAVVASGAGDAYGLADPDVRVTVTVDVPPPPKPASPPTSQPAVTQPAATQIAATQPSTAPGSQPVASAPAEPAEPESREFVLAVTRQDDKTYARTTRSDLIYEIDSVIHEHLTAELLDRTVAKLSTSQVTGLEIVRADEPTRSHKFAKADKPWSYLTDPDVPIDPKKVDELVDKLVGLQAERFISYAAADLAAYQLDAPDLVLTVTRGDGDPIQILIADEGTDDARYATVAGSNRVLLLKAADVEPFDKTVADFEKTDTSS
jgi:hypothetical protein